MYNLGFWSLSLLMISAGFVIVSVVIEGCFIVLNTVNFVIHLWYKFSGDAPAACSPLRGCSLENEKVSCSAGTDAGRHFYCPLRGCRLRQGVDGQFLIHFFRQFAVVK